MILQDLIKNMLAEYEDRIEAIRMAHGIPVWQVVEGIEQVPEGWVLDPLTEYYIPVNLVFRGAKGLT